MRDGSDTYGKALFLAGLSESCEFTDLHQLFEPFGKIVLCRVLKDAKTGKSRRVGYVNFERAEDAMRAMSTLHGKPGPGGATLDIKVAAQDPTFKAVETKKVFVRYVPLNVAASDIREAFAQFGEIDECVVLRDLSRTARREPGPWNMAYVTYKDSKHAIAAVAQASTLIRFGDQELTVKPAVSEETLRLRSRFRQEHGQPAHLPSLPSVPYGAAPQGLVPVVIPGVGLAYMPANTVTGPQTYVYPPPAPFPHPQHHHHQHHPQPLPSAPLAPATASIGGQQMMLVPVSTMQVPPNFTTQHYTPPPQHPHHTVQASPGQAFAPIGPPPRVEYGAPQREAPIWGQIPAPYTTR